MPRYVFTMEDLAPLTRVLGRPDVRRIAARAIPVKQFGAAPTSVEWVVDPLPIRVRTRDNPTGVPLGDVNDLVKSRVPGVRAVIVRDGSVLVTWDTSPTDEMRAQVKGALTDRAAFQAIQERALERPQVGEEDLRAKLLAPSTSDDEWLRAFRRYHTAKLAAELPVRG